MIPIFQRLLNTCYYYDTQLSKSIIVPRQDDKMCKRQKQALKSSILISSIKPYVPDKIIPHVVKG